MAWMDEVELRVKDCAEGEVINAHSVLRHLSSNPSEAQSIHFCTIVLKNDDEKRRRFAHSLIFNA